MVIILILAFSQPVYNAKPKFLNDNPLLLIIDNGWSSSINWEKRKEKYNKYCHYKIKTDNKTIDDIVEEIKTHIKK